MPSDDASFFWIEVLFFASDRAEGQWPETI